MSGTATLQRRPRPRTPDGHATVLGVHGTEGRTGWKAFYTRRELSSPTEAVEWATLPPGAVSGEHRHTRTEEIYLILDGHGDFYLNGEPHPVTPGTLALTTPGNTHGLRNTGDTTLNWWVIETLTPQTQAVLADTDPPRSEHMPTHIADLTETARLETSGIFQGPLTAVQRHLLEPGSHTHLGAAGQEVAGFLNRGTATLAFPGFDGRLEAPIAFLVPAGDTARLEAESEVECYTVELKIGQP